MIYIHVQLFNMPSQFKVYNLQFQQNDEAMNELEVISSSTNYCDIL